MTRFRSESPTPSQEAILIARVTEEVLASASVLHLISAEVRRIMSNDSKLARENDSAAKRHHRESCETQLEIYDSPKPKSASYSPRSTDGPL